MGIQDLIITPIFFLIIFLFIKYYANTKYKNTPFYRYFINTFIIKFAGGIILGIIYQFYYGGGDTFNYYQNNSTLYNVINYDFATGIKILFAKAGDYKVDNREFTRYIYFYSDEGSYFVVRIGTILAFLCRNTYSVISLFFTLFSFSGVWLIFRVFTKEFPHLHRYFAIGILYLPSMIFWGSGYMKDPLSIGALGWLFYGFYQLAIQRKFKIGYVILCLLGIFVLKSAKIYILLSLTPCLLLWFVIHYQKKLNLGPFRYIIAPLLISFTILLGYTSVSKLSEDSDKYSFDSLVETTVVTAFYLKRISDESSSYELSSTFDGSASSLIKLAPEAIIVSFFRPFLWESANPLMLLSGLENTILLFLLLRGIYTYFKVRSKIPSLIKKNSILWLCLLFSILFGISIGLTTYNFGALVRYKIPLLPFLVAIIIITNYNYIEYKKQLIKKLIRHKLRQIS